jgi:hypothetical protein
MYRPEKDRSYYLARHAKLLVERSTWDSEARDVADYHNPRLGRWVTTDRNVGGKRPRKIIDSTATFAVRALVAGMMSGASSPGRQWFRWVPRDPDIAKRHSARKWAEHATQMTERMLRRSNTYRALPQMYEELGLFGTGPAILEPHPRRGIHLYPMTWGQYCIENDWEGNVTSVYREFETTVGELVAHFGYDKACSATRHNWDRRNYEHEVRIVHAIEPVHDMVTMGLGGSEQKWTSVYIEHGDDGNKQLLDEHEYDRFPVLCPRWEVTSNDAYGRGLAMATLGDVMQLQHMQLQKAKAIEYQVEPPLDIPGDIKNRDIDRLPGGLTSTSGGERIQAMWEVRLNLADLKQSEDEIRQRLRTNYFTDLFLMLASSDRRQMTATEVAERHQEKLLMLGPVYERMHTELFEPLVEFAFYEAMKRGEIMPPPPELAGAELGIEFVSMLAQAQRAVGTVAVDRVLAVVQAVGAVGRPEAADKLDPDALLDFYSDALGAPVDILRSTEEVQALRQARAAAQAEAKKAEMMAVHAGAARDMASAPTDQRNALTDVVSMFSGYGTPGAA